MLTNLPGNMESISCPSGAGGINGFGCHDNLYESVYRVIDNLHKGNLSAAPDS